MKKLRKQIRNYKHYNQKRRIERISRKKQEKGWHRMVSAFFLLVVEELEVAVGGEDGVVAVVEPVAGVHVSS